MFESWGAGFNLICCAESNHLGEGRAQFDVMVQSVIVLGGAELNYSLCHRIQ